MKFLGAVSIVLMSASAGASDAASDAIRTKAEQFSSHDNSDITANGFRLRGTGLEAGYAKSVFIADTWIWGAKGAGSEEKVLARFYNANMKLLGETSLVFVRRNHYNPWSIPYDPTAVTVELEATGGDAILIDRAGLYNYNGDIIKSWGDEKGKEGWCMSTDPSDFKGWEKYVSDNKCHKILRFLSNGQVYPVDSSDEWQSLQ